MLEEFVVHAVVEGHEDVVGDGHEAVVVGAAGHSPAVDLDSHGGRLGRKEEARRSGSIERQDCSRPVRMRLIRSDGAP